MSEFVPVSEAANDPKRLYAIQNVEVYYFTGTNRDNNQVILGRRFPNYAVLTFSPSGECISIATHAMPEGAFTVVNGIYRGDYDVIDAGLEAFQETIGFVPGTIHVAKFWLEDEYIGIKDMPEYMIDIPGDETEEDAIERKELTDEWIADKCFVLWWGNDYWLNGDGEVESS